MITSLRKLCLLAFVAAMVVAGGARAQTTLQLNRWLPPTHFFNTEVLDAWAKHVEQATEGRVRIQLTASSLGPPPRQFDLVRSGVAEVVWGVQGYTPGRFLTSEGVELPFLGNSAAALSVAYWRTYQKHFARANEYDDIKLLSLHVHPPGELYTASVPLHDPEDIEGLKIRVPNPITARIVELLGGVGVAAPSSKAYELLSRGVVDGTFLTADAVPQFNLTKFLDHQMVVAGGFFNASFFLAMNKKAWAGLSRQDQQAIERLSGEAFAKRAGAAWDAQRVEGQKILEAKGIKTTRVEGAALETLKRTIGDFEQAWIQAVSKRGVDGAEALEMLRREAARYSGAK